jgi:hypothetical protein
MEKLNIYMVNKSDSPMIEKSNSSEHKMNLYKFLINSI